MNRKLIVVMTIAIVCSWMTSGCESRGQKPNDKVMCDDKAYTFRIGEIVRDGNANTTTIQLLLDGQKLELKGSFSSNSLPGSGRGMNISNFQVVSPVKMDIVVGSKTFKCSNDIMLQGDMILFTFSTSDSPDKIIVYSNDEKKSTVAYDGKTKEVVSAN